MAKKYLPPLYEVDNTTGAGVATVTYEPLDNGALEGEVCEHLICNLVESGATVALQLQIFEHPTFGTTVRPIAFANNASAVVLQVGQVPQPFGTALVFGNDTTDCYFRPVIVEGWRLRLGWTGVADGGDISKVWLQTSRPFGSPDSAGMWQVHPQVIAFNESPVVDNSSVILTDLGLSPGDVILYLVTNYVAGSITQLDVKFEKLIPGTSTWVEMVCNSADGPPADTVSPMINGVTGNISAAIIPANPQVGRVQVIVQEDMRIRLSTVGSTAGSTMEMGLFYATPFG